MALGITTIPENAPRDRERMFVRMWIAIVVFLVLWIGILFVWITS